MRIITLFFALLTSASSAPACPWCDGGPAGNAVRAEVFGSEFGLHFLAVVAPFVVLVVTALLVGRSPRKGGP